MKVDNEEDEDFNLSCRIKEEHVAWKPKSLSMVIEDGWRSMKKLFLKLIKTKTTSITYL